MPFNFYKLMKKLFFLLCFAQCFFNLQAQKHDYIWKQVYPIYPQYNSNMILPYATVDFNYRPPLVTVDSARIPPTLACELVSMSDSLGSYVFYTNGNSLINIDNQIMQNGDSLNYGAYSQNYPTIELGYRVIDGAICLPSPGNNNFYDLLHLKVDSFYIGYPSFINQLLRTKIDMIEDTGTVIIKNQIILEDSLTSGQLQAVKHANGRDWWILISQLNTNGYYTFLLKVDTLEGPFYQQIGRDIYSLKGYGQACFSPDGTKYARVEDDFDLYDFDRCTGELCNHRYVQIDGFFEQPNDIGQGGCSFSPSGRFIYVTQGYHLFQIDLWANNLDSAIHTIDIINPNDDPDSGYFSCRLAPDNKIYINGSFDSAWSVINAPDNFGTACNAVRRGFNIGIFDCAALPNFPHYRMSAQDSCPPCGTFAAVPQLEVSELTSIKVYPNPAYNGSFNISIQENAADDVQIYDLLGRLLLQEAWDNAGSEKEIQLPLGAKGVYFVSVWKEEKLIGREKLVVLE
jgi:hypothetical protein